MSIATEALGQQVGYGDIGADLASQLVVRISLDADGDIDTGHLAHLVNHQHGRVVFVAILMNLFEWYMDKGGAAVV